MASYTANYGLHQWEAADDFLRTDFNTDFEMIDEALTGLEMGKIEMVTGAYTGTGEALRTIALGFQAKVLFLERADGRRTGADYVIISGMALADHPVQRYVTMPIIKSTASGFQLQTEDANARNRQKSIGSQRTSGQDAGRDVFLEALLGGDG